MRQLLFILACLFVFAQQAHGQGILQNPIQGPITASSTNCVTQGDQSCLWMKLPANTAVVSVTVSGTFSETLVAEYTGDSGAHWTTAATLTTAGLTSYVVAGMTDFRVRASTVVSGTALITIQASLAPSGGVTSGTTDPTGNACAANALYVRSTNGFLYTCDAGVFALLSGGASGTVTNIATTGPITGGPITTTGTIACATCVTSAASLGSGNVVSGAGGQAVQDSTIPTSTLVTSAAALTSNSVVLGAGSQGTKTATFITTNGSNQLTVGTSGGGNGVVALGGNVSGAATITAPATAGTAGNPIVFSNAGQFGGTLSVTTGGIQSDATHAFIWAGRSQMNSTADGIITFGTNANSQMTRMLWGPDTTSSPALCNSGTSLLLGQGGANCTTLSGLTTGTLKGNLYASGTNCSSSASPAVCAAALAGSVAIPAGALQTLQVNTTAVTANSQILLTIDEGLGTKLGVTCNTTVATLTQPVVTARSAATSFTIEEPATTSVNPVCVSYMVMN